MRRRMLMGDDSNNDLPNGYTRLNYIESTGTQYIDTGYAFTSNNIKIDIDYEIVIKNQGCIFGSLWMENSATYHRSMILYGYEAWGGTYFGMGFYDNTLGFTFDSNIRYKASFEYNGQVLVISVEGYEELKKSSVSNNVNNKNIYLFAVNSSDTAERISKIKVYSFSMYDNGERVRNFIPCQRQSDNALGMYDTVTKKLFMNEGLGEFIGG